MGNALAYFGLIAAPPPDDEDEGRHRRRRSARDRAHRGLNKRSEKNKAKFKFRSDEANSSFECRLDDGEFEDCDSPQKYRGLDPGRHRFRVRATDAAGNTDGSPARYRWKYVPKK